MNKRTIIIGDVHGMDVELHQLFEKLIPRQDDQIVFVGDLLDKGPNSSGVVKMVRELSSKHDVVLVEGNHEDKHRRFRKHLAKGSDTAHKMKDADELAEITDGLSADDKAFLDSAVPFHRIPEHNILVVHAGIPGDMTEFPENVEEAQALGGKRKKKFQLVMRTRFVNGETGKMLQLGAETESDPFWAEVFDGRFGHVVFGHQPFMDGVREFPHATGIDTGAVFGGGLTAMVIEGGEKSFVSVPSRKCAVPLGG